MHSPERILEALAWLYGGEFNVDDNVSYLKDTAYIFEPKAGSVNGQRPVIFVRNNGYAMAAWPYRRREDITNTLAHALDVTAPWEWVADCTSQSTFKNDVVSVRVRDFVRYAQWSMEFVHADVKELLCIERNTRVAKENARTFFLTYMRGCLALRGIGK